jgi:small subunit ribosomal protein S16
MLAIRLQRTGRHGHAHFRMIVQDSRFSPKSGRVVAFLGNYNPHTKEAKIDTEKATSFLSNGAQPSERAAKLLQKEGVKLPDWVKLDEPKKRDIRNPEKLRRNQSASTESTANSTEEAQTESPAVEPDAEEQPAAGPEAQPDEAVEPVEETSQSPSTEEVPQEESKAATVEEKPAAADTEQPS